MNEYSLAKVQLCYKTVKMTSTILTIRYYLLNLH